MMLSLVAAAALAASPYRPLTAAPSLATPICTKEGKLAQASDGKGVANLPFAMGRTFDSLDDYLSHLKCSGGPIGKPWWREVRPDVYEHVTSATNAQKEVATRAELMQRFGFSR